MCKSKLQDEIQNNIRILHQEQSKGKSIYKACQVLTEDMFYILHLLSRMSQFWGTMQCSNSLLQKGNAGVFRLSARSFVGPLEQREL